MQPAWNPGTPTYQRLDGSDQLPDPQPTLCPQKLRTVSDDRRWSHRRLSTPRERERSHT